VYSVYVDGASSFNQDPKRRCGGSAYLILRHPDDSSLQGSRQLPGYTNNQSELVALIDAMAHLLKYATKDESICVYTDSKYVFEPLSTGYIEKWRAKKWRTVDGKKKILNKDLWIELYELIKGFMITYHKINSNSSKFDPINVHEKLHKYVNDMAKKEARPDAT
jgi:ribonuclease HI